MKSWSDSAEDSGMTDCYRMGSNGNMCSPYWAAITRTRETSLILLQPSAAKIPANTANRTQNEV
jgi:hypothetical protein